MADRRSGNEGSGDSSGEDEDSESSSSSSFYESASVGEAGVDLNQFRENWRAEIIAKQDIDESPNVKDERQNTEEFSDILNVIDPREREAKRLFRLGTREEGNGNLYGAIDYYRRAYQIMPDIEIRIAQQQRRKRRNSTRKRLDSGSSVDSNGSTSQDVRGAEGTVGALSNVVEGDEADDGDKNNNSATDEKAYEEEEMEESSRNGWCQPEVPIPDAERHLSDLPIEVMLFIFKWIIGSHLDVHALNQISLVCRCFHDLARDEELWRLICIRTWGANCGSLCDRYPSWRSMLFIRPRVHLDGCYMGRVSYIRRGEPMIGSVYRPCYIVEYYRSIRFYPDGVFYMMTTPDPPESHVRFLKSRPPVKQAHGVLEGHYRINDKIVTGVLQWRKPYQSNASWRTRRKPTNPTASDHQMFQVQFLLKSSKKKFHNILEWQSYTFIQKSKSGNKDVVCDFNMDSDSYPSLYFSRVKSYTAEVTDRPLE